MREVIELPPGFVLRRPRLEDAEAVVALMIAEDVADCGYADSTLEDLTADWALPRFDRDRDAWLVVGPDGSIVGYAWVWDRIPNQDLQADLHVQPPLKGQGIEPVLLRLLEERAAEHRTAAPDRRVHLSLFAKPESVLAGILLARGYARIRTFLRMTIHLPAAYAAPSWPPGIEIRGFRRHVDEEILHRVVEESFANHFRFAPEPHPEWVERRVGHPEFDPALWRIAWDGSQAAGAVLAYQFGDLGWVRELGVLAPWRGRGIGKALLLETFQLFVGRGQRRVSLGVDAENATGATRLYEDVGMFVEERHDLFSLALPPID